MAPEIIENWRQYSYEVDIWAISVMLYEMMYNSFPFGI